MNTFQLYHNENALLSFHYIFVADKYDWVSSDTLLWLWGEHSVLNIENKIWEERVDQVITQDEDELIKDNTRINSSQHLFIRWCCIVGERHSTTHLRTT